VTSLLARAGTRVRVGGRALEIPYRPAAEWVMALDRLPVLVHQLASPEVREVLARMVFDRHPRAVQDMEAESRRILAEATGRPWWEAGRLLNTSSSPDVLGRMILKGADPWLRTVGEWCAATYALCVDGASEEARLRFDFQLSIPPAGEEDQWDDGVDPAAAMAQIAAMTGRQGG